jgi:SAM-dependent methyltransferase
LIRKIHSVLKAEGLGGLLGVAYRRAFPYRHTYFKLCKPSFENKTGLEIGGPSGMFRRKGSLPIYPVAARIDNCNFGHRTTWEGAIEEGPTFHYDRDHAPGNQYVAEATRLGAIASSSYDFVLSSHTLEHVANPLQALTEWIRVLKEGGLLVLALPHRDGTFDHRRPVTSLAHLVQDLERQTTEDDLTHLDEILQLHDLSRDPEAGSAEQFAERSRRNFENRCLHQHVFDTRLAVEVVHHMGFQILAVDAFRPYDIVLIVRKPKPDQLLQNERFRNVTKPDWRSPFPSDRRNIR